MTPLRDDDPAALGRFRILGRLGEGGMGAVYLGRGEDGRLAAVKVIRHDLARQPEFLARFRREAEIAQRVARFCTAEVLDVDVDAPRPYLVTEFIDGPTLSEAIVRDGPMAPADLERLAISVAAALTAIHGAGMVHRDLKPSNVVLSRLGPRVIDFGIARALDTTSSLTAHIGPIGTPAFMAPEQARGEPVSAAADIFAWGGVVTFAGTGNGPFGNASTPVLLFRAVFEQPKLDGLPTGLRSVVEKAMAKDPAARPSAQEVYQSLLGLSGVRTAPVAPDNGDEVATTMVVKTPPQPPPVTHLPARTTPPRLAREPAGLVPVEEQPASVPPRKAESGRGRERPRRLRRYRPILVAAAAVLSVVAVVAGLLVANARDAGGPGPGDRDTVSRRLAAQAEVASTNDPRLARQLSLAAYQVAPTVEAGRSLVESFGGTEVGELLGHTAKVIGVRFSPDGRTLVTGSNDRTVRLWDVHAPAQPTQLAVITGETGTLLQGGFSADGRLLATSADDHTMRLWDITNPAAPHEVAFLADVNNSVAFAVGGKIMATAGTDDTARLWDITNPSQPRSMATLVGHTDWVNSVAFSADGRMLATASHDMSIRLWDVSEPSRPSELAILTGHTGPVLGLAFHPEGKILGSTGGDRTARLWDISASPPKPLFTFTDRSDWVSSVAFRVDGHLMGTTSRKAARLWDIADPRAPRQVGGLVGHTDTVRRVQFSPDGNLAATSGDDNSARLWDLNPAHIAEQACKDPTAVMTEEQWGANVPEIPYESPCGR